MSDQEMKEFNEKDLYLVNGGIKIETTSTGLHIELEENETAVSAIQSKINSLPFKVSNMDYVLTEAQAMDQANKRFCDISYSINIFTGKITITSINYY